MTFPLSPQSQFTLSTGGREDVTTRGEMWCNTVICPGNTCVCTELVLKKCKKQLLIYPGKSFICYFSKQCMTSIGKDGKKNSKKNGFLCLETATRAGWQRGQALVAAWLGRVAQGGGRGQQAGGRAGAAGSWDALPGGLLHLILRSFSADSRL